MKHFKVTQSFPEIKGKKDNVLHFCQHCLDSNHKDIKKDWFNKVDETSEQKCDSYAHKENMRKLLNSSKVL